MNYRPDAHVKWIVIHYSATAVEEETTLKDIDAMHRRRGFREIGYHIFIRKSGLVEYGRDLMQPGRFEMGAHSKGENDASVGMCYEGGVFRGAPNVGRDTRTAAQTASLIAEIDKLLERFGGDGVNPALGPVVEGHKDMPGAATQCPGFNAASWWRDVSGGRRLGRTGWSTTMKSFTEGRW